MSDESNKSCCATSETASSGNVVPIWLFGLMFCLLFLAAWTFDLRGGWFEAQVYTPYNSVADLQRFQPPPLDLPEGYLRGKKVYENCAACHQASGMGSSAVGAPPLVNSEWVLAPKPDRMIRIVLDGLSGPIQVSGQSYGTGVMTPFRAALTDQQIADVLTYIRMNIEWKHKASEVTPEQVATIRKVTETHSVNWSASELEKIPVD